MVVLELDVADIGNLKSAHINKSIEVKVYQKWTARNVPDSNLIGLCFVLLEKKSHAVQANVQVRDIRCFYSILQLNSIDRTHDFGCQKTDKWQRMLDNDTALALGKYTQASHLAYDDFPCHYFNFTAYNELGTKSDAKDPTLIGYIGCIQKVGDTKERGHQAGVGGAPNLTTRPETADGEYTTTSSAVHEGTSDSHMPSQIRHVAKRIRTRPTSAPGTTGTPTRPAADARTGPPNEYRAFTPCNCRCSLSPTFEAKLRKGQKETWLAVKVSRYGFEAGLPWTCLGTRVGAEMGHFGISISQFLCSFTIERGLHTTLYYMYTLG